MFSQLSAFVFSFHCDFLLSLAVILMKSSFQPWGSGCLFLTDRSQTRRTLRSFCLRGGLCLFVSHSACIHLPAQGRGIAKQSLPPGQKPLLTPECDSEQQLLAGPSAAWSPTCPRWLAVPTCLGPWSPWALGQGRWQEQLLSSTRSFLPPSLICQPESFMRWSCLVTMSTGHSLATPHHPLPS